MPKESKMNHSETPSVRRQRGSGFRFFKLAAITLFLVWLIAACGAAPLKQLEQAEQTWTSQGITSYRIEVREVRSIWHAQTYTIIVENNQITDAQAQCIPAPSESGTCEVQAYEAEDYLVPALFSRARSELQGPRAVSVKITYDPTYGFPSAISIDDPEALDDDWSLGVTSFEVIR
jgi:hypothetical protein